MGAAPQVRSSAARAVVPELKIWKGPGAPPGSTTSSPVDRIATVGARETFRLARPAEAARDRRQGSSRTPGFSSSSPALKS